MHEQTLTTAPPPLSRQSHDCTSAAPGAPPPHIPSLSAVRGPLPQSSAAAKPRQHNSSNPGNRQVHLPAIVRKHTLVALLRTALTLLLTLGGLLWPTPPAECYTLTPQTWNTVGLDSNDVNTGPNLFPVGAKVCGGTEGSSVDVYFAWLSSNSYIDLRPGSKGYNNTPLNIYFRPGGGGCADAFFEAEVQRNAAVFDTSREYKIYIGADSTPTPRALYAERLISQSRNGITDVKVNGVSIPAGGAMNLVVGNTYTIELIGGTATQGYNQFASFFSLSNTIFQILSVSSVYSANNSPYVPDPVFGTGLYADACKWDNDPNSLSYRSCIGGDYKAGGSPVTTTYQIRIIGGGGTAITLSSLLYDFSGSSYHYNGDYSTSARIATIIDPASVNITKSFSPNPTNVNGLSTLTFTLSNPNAGAVSGLNFTDIFPTSPGVMAVAATPNAVTNGCGAASFAPVAGATSIAFTNGTVAANSSCTIQVDVTTTATGTYTNTTNHLFAGTSDTGKTATATLTVNTTPPLPPPPSACTTRTNLATWIFESPAAVPNPAYTTKQTNVATATATLQTIGGAQSLFNLGAPYNNAWGGTAPTGQYGWSETATSWNNYFQITVDTSKYGDVSMSFDGRPDIPGDWGNPSSNVFASINTGSGFTSYTPTPASILKNNWGALTVKPSSTGSSMIVRLAVDGSGKKTGATFYLDNIIISGCANLAPPTMTKTFLTNPVAVNGVSTLKLTITNPNTDATSGLLTGVTFIDNLPAGLEVAAIPAASTTCGGAPSWAPTAGATALSFGQTTGATVPIGGSCDVYVDIKATTPGPHNNVSDFVKSANGGTNTTATGIAKATLTAVQPPTITKVFARNPILANGTSRLTFTVNNPNQNNTLTGVTFTDVFPTSPGAMTVATPFYFSNTCGGTLTDNSGTVLAAGDAGIKLAGATIPNGSSCTVTVDVTAAALGAYVNSTQVSDATAGTGNTDSDTLTVTVPHPAIGLLKEVAASGTPAVWSSELPLAVGGNVYYQLSIYNDGDVRMDNVTISDPAFTAATIATCAWKDGDDAPATYPLTLQVANSNDNKDFAYCIIGPVTVQPGTTTNTATATGQYNSTNYTDSDWAKYYGFTPPTATKSFSPASIVTGGTSTLTITVTNPAANPGNLTGVSIGDSYSGTLVNNAAGSLACTAGSSATLSGGANGGTSVGFNAGTIVPGGTCTITQSVTATSTTNNTTAAPASTGIVIAGKSAPLALTGTAASATLTIGAALPSLTVIKSVQPVSDPVNGTTTPKPIPGAVMQYTIQVMNSGAGVVDNNSTVITDVIPANTVMCVTNTCSNPPVTRTFCSAAPACGLSITFPADVTYSNQVGGGTPYTYTPVPDADGYDATVTGVRINPQGILNAAAGGNPADFRVTFKAKIK